MKWKGPDRLQKRTVKRFAWLPVTFNDGTKIWWETYYQDQMYNINNDGDSYWFPTDRSPYQKNTTS